MRFFSCATLPQFIFIFLRTFCGYICWNKKAFAFVICYFNVSILVVFSWPFPFVWSVQLIIVDEWIWACLWRSQKKLFLLLSQARVPFLTHFIASRQIKRNSWFSMLIRIFHGKFTKIVRNQNQLFVFWFLFNFQRSCDKNVQSAISVDWRNA